MSKNEKNEIIDRLDQLTKMLALVFLSNAKKVDYREVAQLFSSMGLSKKDISMIFSSIGLYEFDLSFL